MTSQGAIPVFSTNRKSSGFRGLAKAKRDVREEKMQSAEQFSCVTCGKIFVAV
jgi:hypothetical protein